MDSLKTFLSKVPKVELHLHLEGAIPVETLYGLIRRSGREPAIGSVGDLREKLSYTSFEHFIELWTWKNTFIRSEQDFDAIAYEVLHHLSGQNVVYVEATYSPGDYHRQGLSVEGITECMIAGAGRARRDFGIRCELIVDLIRDHGPAVGMKRLDEITPFLGKGVIGVGLGGSEQMFPAGPYREVYAEAARRGFGLTAHAGEAAGAESIWAAIRELGVERIGHGVRAYEDPELVRYLETNKMPLEMCIISNVRTRVCESASKHPIRRYFDQGLVVTVNSDDPTMFNTTLTDEYLALARELDFTPDELEVVALNGIGATFLPETERQLMRSEFRSRWREIGRAFLP